MICLRTIKRFCCEDISLIENYDLAINDKTQTWDCHHRLETELNLSVSELKSNNMYYDRPACELIFLTQSDHMSLHSNGRKLSDETRNKLSESCKGRIVKEETRKKISESFKGHIVKEKTRKKISESHKGKHRVYREDGTYYYE